jgi:hypothetical protein
MIQSRWDWETVFGATPKTATGTGALPSQVPAGRPMAVWGGRMGQRAVEFLAADETRMKHRFFEARQGWHICSIAIHQRTKLRQERHRIERN